MATETKYVFKLDPYDRKAKNVLKYLRKCLAPNYRIVVRGRGPRPQAGDSQGLPLSRAKWVAVYIFRKDADGRMADFPRVPLLPEGKQQPTREPMEKLPAGGSLDELIGKLRKGEKAGV